MKKWVSLHQHTDESNAGGYFEVVTQYTDYVKYAKEHELPAVCITNHGNVARWMKHKMAINDSGMKYIHGIEAYVTMDLEDKNRGYHTILIAKNYEGVKEINKLSSASFNRKDGHFYYKPRVLFSDLIKTSNNVFVTTACLAGALWQNSPHYNHQSDKKVEGNKEYFDQWMDFIINNKERVYLEIQPHLDEDQKEYNKLLLKLAAKYNLKLIASNDIHALNPRHNDIRLMIKNGKGSSYEGDDKFELWCKDYDEMKESFRQQGVVDEDIVEKALDATMEIEEQVEDFEIDRSHKYPHLFKDEEGKFKELIVKGMKDRGILDFPKKKLDQYVKRVNHEYKVYKHNGAISYMLADWLMIQEAKKQGRNVGYSRGSVSGSLIAYLLHSTEMDSIKHGLNFERFMNPERISLADIDHDWSGKDKIQVQKWLLTNPNLYCASIMTANTYGLKGAIKVIAKGMDGYKDKSPFEIQGICNQIDIKDNYPDSIYQSHKKLFDTAKEIIGVIDSFGRHACGIVVSTEPIDDVMGTQTVSGWDYPVTQVYMKEIDYCNFTKFDVLGLDNLGLITKTCELAGLPFLTPDSSDVIDFQDEKVWKSMTESNIGIFQFEGERAGSILRHLFSDETIDRIKEKVPDIKFIDLLSLANAAQRPSGASYLESVTEGRFTDNGHKALNDFLAPTLGNLVYQEQLIEFLVKFCGWNYGQADLIRRGIGKKLQSIMDEEVPKIKPSFIKTMIEEYGDTEEHANEVADRFIQVFMDAVNYGFSVNHSMAYSYIGYIATWLRYYYPLEFCTAAFEVWGDNQDKINKVTRYADSHGINLKQAKFGKSKGLYFMNKEDNSIYEGTEPIKGNNAQVGDDLYDISKLQDYSSFTELLLKISDNSYVTLENGENIDIESVYKTKSESELKVMDKQLKAKEISLQQSKYAINRTKLEGLIRLDYFMDFGKSEKLQKIYNYFMENYKPKNKTLSGKAKKYLMCVEYEKGLEDTDYPFITKLGYELFYTGKCNLVNSTMPAKYVFVVDADVRRTRTRAIFYSIRTGKEIQVLIGSRAYREVPFKTGDLIEIQQYEEKPRSVLIDGVWTKHPTDKDIWLQKIKLIRKGEVK
ncbi:PHP domain-containing protein [Liquorilactobacillus hordei]|uniref:PHP domain-containing protein n=1 Tax=Liquorilactobacillus hordei TaxID=468911 RepID=UPI0039E7A6FD